MKWHTFKGRTHQRTHTQKARIRSLGHFPNEDASLIAHGHYTTAVWREGGLGDVPRVTQSNRDHRTLVVVPDLRKGKETNDDAEDEAFLKRLTLQSGSGKNEIRTELTNKGRFRYHGAAQMRNKTNMINRAG